MSFGDQWQSATINDSSDPPEPGTYEVALEDAKAFIAKSGGEWFVVDFRIVAGAEAGHTWSVLSNLSKDGGVKAAKSMSAKLGVPIDEVNSLEDLDRLVKEHVGSYFEVDVVQKGDFRNTYIREAMVGVPVSDIPSNVPVTVPADDVDPDDIPF